LARELAALGPKVSAKLKISTAHADRIVALVAAGDLRLLEGAVAARGPSRVPTVEDIFERALLTESTPTQRLLPI
jgi:hypothetical protein